MYLPDDNAGIFDMFLNYIYKDCLSSFPSKKFADIVKGVDRYTEEVSKLFYLAEKFCINDLANRVMDQVQDVHASRERIPGPDDVENVYKNTHETSKLRRYCTMTRIYGTRQRGTG
jgi:hypothetical protein